MWLFIKLVKTCHKTCCKIHKTVKLVIKKIYVKLKNFFIYKFYKFCTNSQQVLRQVLCKFYKFYETCTISQAFAIAQSSLMASKNLALRTLALGMSMWASQLSLVREDKYSPRRYDQTRILQKHNRHDLRLRYRAIPVV